MENTHGMAYAALSRAVNPATLIIQNLSKLQTAALASPTTLDFYENLDAIYPEAFDEGHIVVTNISILSTFLKDQYAEVE